MPLGDTRVSPTEYAVIFAENGASRKVMPKLAKDEIPAARGAVWLCRVMVFLNSPDLIALADSRMQAALKKGKQQ